MKIKTGENLVEFTPESEQEVTELAELWNVVVDCVKFNKQLNPVGEFIPGKNELARFAIEG